MSGPIPRSKRSSPSWPHPLYHPRILSTISWILLLSPKIGLINLFFMKLFHVEKSSFNIYSLPGMIWAEGIHLYLLFS